MTAPNTPRRMKPLRQALLSALPFTVVLAALYTLASWFSASVLLDALACLGASVFLSARVSRLVYEARLSDRVRVIAVALSMGLLSFGLVQLTRLVASRALGQVPPIGVGPVPFSVVEIALLLGVPVFLALAKDDEVPTCPRCGAALAPRVTGLPLERGSFGDAPLRSIVYEGIGPVLARARPAGESASEWVSLTLLECPGCRRSALLTMELLTSTLSRQGPKITRAPFAKLPLEDEQLDQVRERMEAFRIQLHPAARKP